MSDENLLEGSPFVFEISWEVCNKVGGIYTVLATKAEEMVKRYGDRYILIGPKVWGQDSQKEPTDFIPDHGLPELMTNMRQAGIDVSCGRWDIPGRPHCLLVDFSSSYKAKDQILEELWLAYQVDSLTGGWDYIEPVLFGYTAGTLIQRFAGLYARESEVIAHWHEWLVGSGLLHLKTHAPEIASVFTTHATILGRSIAGTGERLEKALQSLDATARANALHIRAKFSLEKALVTESDCFTTVSGTTADEAFGIYQRRADVLLPNALGEAFPDPGLMEPDKVSQVRGELMTLAETMTGQPLDREHTRLWMTSGRYEYINKGVNLFVDALSVLNENNPQDSSPIVAFFFLPTDHGGPQPDLLACLDSDRLCESPLFATHSLTSPGEDPLFNHCKKAGLTEVGGNRVRVIFAPVYLDGSDGVFNREYYELLPAFDLTVFPSHYEPWGYTPLESIGLGVPTITSDLAGFGQWAAAQRSLDESSVYVLPRANHRYGESLDRLTGYLEQKTRIGVAEAEHARETALALAGKARWGNFARFYQEAHRQALLSRTKRMPSAAKRFNPKQVTTESAEPAAPFEVRDYQTMHWRPFTVRNRIPETLTGLQDLAYNLWWTWDWDAESLFRDLDSAAWETCGHNPVKLLDYLEQATLDQAAADEAFMARYQGVLARYENYLSDRTHQNPDPAIAYFCMEYGLHECLPLYSGGLGVLAGDHLKAASDLNLPLVAVGLAYRAGYFRQKFDVSGQQIDEPMQLDFTGLPMRPLCREDGSPLLVKILFPGHRLSLAVWKVQVGSVQLLLLDTDIPENGPLDRAITGSLYGGDKEMRLKQEMVLGIGGRNLLSELNYQPKVWHLNEGHASFLTLSRAGALMQQHHIDFNTAIEYCRETALFTTHTPVPAGHDVFSEDLMRPYFSLYRHILHVSWDRIMNLGRYPQEPTSSSFSMTVLGMRGAADVNGVSQLHGEVSRRNLQPITPGYHWREVPVGAITNGVHLPTWLAHPLQEWLNETLPEKWWQAPQDDALWAGLAKLDKTRFREIRRELKRSLLEKIREQIEGVWDRHQDAPGLLNTILGNLEEDALVIGFARRFAPYKRATLLFRDLDALAKLVTNPDRPVVFIFAGKAHPADEMGKALIKQIHQISRQAPFQGRIILLENYDLALAKYLVRGCDVWLNTPTRPLEASGTSGMKAAMNGVVNVSVLDGWWAEGYNGKNGWAIGEDRVYDSPDYQDDYDSQHLYALLEEQVMPRYFEGGKGLSDTWLETALEAMATSLAPFSARRMLGEYRDRYYHPGMGRAVSLAENGFQAVSQSADQKERLRHLWDHVRVLEHRVGGIQDGSICHGDEVSLHLTLQHPGLAASELVVQMVVAQRGSDGELDGMVAIPLDCNEEGEVSKWQGVFRPDHSGPKAYGLRVVPRLPLERHGVATDLALVQWVH